MFSSAIIWGLIVLALVLATLPFMTEKTFVFVPWRQFPERSATPIIILRAVLNYILLGLSAYWILIGNEFLMLFGAFLLLAALSMPRYILGKVVKVKKLSVRIIELAVFYFIIGVIGFAIEAYYTNPIDKDWQFYVISLCLFLVLAYPGFVYRHLYKKTKSAV